MKVLTILFVAEVLHMPQKDRYKENRNVEIEFIYNENFKDLPYKDRYTMILVTNGSMNLKLNNYPIKKNTPFVICLSPKDRLIIQKEENVAAQALHFHPDFFDTAHFSDSENYFSTNLKIKTGISLFEKKNNNDGVHILSDKIYPKIYEWFFVIGTEIYAQSDELWVCRIKTYLVKILDLLDKLYMYDETTPLNLALEYIHANYSEKISLEDITKYSHLNRVSLNKAFQELCGNTAMGYLIEYRLTIAENLLTHTGMSLNEIARITGFEYDTYFIKQFTQKRKMSPTQYRNTSRDFVKQKI